MTKLNSHIEKLGQLLENFGVDPAPIIVLGMHRSGTTLLAKILQATGVFMGARLSGNIEPRLIQDANRQIFDFFGASWLEPQLLPLPPVLKAHYDGLAIAIAERLIDDLALFFGFNPSSRLWGFKDPRTCVTAGLFSKLFPTSKTIFIYRNPLDVAASIVVREQKIRRKNTQQPQFEFSKEELRFLLLRSVQAWEEYNQRALDSLPFFSSYSVISYERLIRSPISTLSETLGPLKLKISACSISEVGISTENSGSASNLPLDLTFIQNYLDDSIVYRKLESL